MSDFEACFAETFGARRDSARVVLDHLEAWLQPRSLLDVGCGPGAWMVEARARGMAEVVGLDRAGTPVDSGVADAFRPVDLQQPPDLGRRFDLVVCLEVAEHLPPERAEAFVGALMAYGDAVLFSAAIPLQGGIGHVNERFQDYWAGLFRRVGGYRAVDALRPRLWNDARVLWWLRQNMVLYVAEPVLGRTPDLASHEVTEPGRLATVHPEMHRVMAERLASCLPGGCPGAGAAK